MVTKETLTSVLNVSLADALQDAKEQCVELPNFEKFYPWFWGLKSLEQAKRELCWAHYESDPARSWRFYRGSLNMPCIFAINDQGAARVAIVEFNLKRGETAIQLLDSMARFHGFKRE